MHCAQHVVEGAGDRGVAVVRGVLIEKGRCGRGVPEPTHELLSGCAGGRGQARAGVAEFVRPDSRQTDGAAQRRTSGEAAVCFFRWSSSSGRDGGWEGTARRPASVFGSPTAHRPPTRRTEHSTRIRPPGRTSERRRLGASPLLAQRRRGRARVRNIARSFGRAPVARPAAGPWRREMRGRGGRPCACRHRAAASP